MRKIAESSHTGSDRVIFYDIGADSGDARYSHIRIVHLQEWSDLVGEIEAEDMEKYNVVAHDVCVWGYDGASPTYAENCRDVYNDGTMPLVGKSVTDSLSSCGFLLTVVLHTDGAYHVRIVNEYDNHTVCEGRMTDKSVALVIAEAMYGHGTGDRAHDASGNNARELLRAARNA